MRCAQANEFGEAEVWMNERLMRSAPKGFASFVTAFEGAPSGNRATAGKPAPLWLVWRYEGNFTLADLMKVRRTMGKCMRVPITDQCTCPNR